MNFRRRQAPADDLREAVRYTLIRGRKRLGLTQQQMADRIGCPRQYWSKLESKTVTPTLGQLCRLAVFLGQTPKALIQEIEARRLIFTGRRVCAWATDGTGAAEK
jgi:transcriptional regulator with XRE-family HTH domain